MLFGCVSCFCLKMCSRIPSPRAGSENKIGLDFLPQMPIPNIKGAAVRRSQASSINKNLIGSLSTSKSPLQHSHDYQKLKSDRARGARIILKSFLD